MSYPTMIADAIRTTDPAMLALVEDIMREGRSGLDSLTRAEFDREARKARKLVTEMAAEGFLAEYCDALRLAIPTI